MFTCLFIFVVVVVVYGRRRCGVYFGDSYSVRLIRFMRGFQSLIQFLEEFRTSLRF